MSPPPAAARATSSTSPRPAPGPRRACEECNRKKARCDRRRPICGPCSRTGSSCHFPLHRKKPAPRKPPVAQPHHQLRNHLSKLARALEAITRNADDNETEVGTQATSRSLLQDSLNSILAELESPEGRNLDNTALTADPNDPSHESEDQHLDGREESEPGGQDANLPDTTDRSSRIEPHAPSPILDTDHEIPLSLARELVDLFFDKIQPWLPLLHKPRFLARFQDKLRGHGNLPGGLDRDEELTLYGMFALSARFSNHPTLGGIPPLERGDRFAQLAANAYGKSRLSPNPPFVHLQGCILLAFYFYTSGPSQQGWILIGVCVRLAYILGLSEIDDDESGSSQPTDAVEKEELRRAWWLVWELDAFASIMFRKPFAIDRKRIAVKLPISDEAWFSEVDVESAEIIATSRHTWRSLQAKANQDARAWFLLASHYMSSIYDGLQREELTMEDKLMLENEVACFKMALPPALRLDTEPMDFSDATFAKCNWVIAMHIMLMMSSFMISGVTINSANGNSPANGGPGSTLPLRQRAVTLSRILNQWDAKYIPLAQPFLSCMIVAQYAVDNEVLRAHPLVASSHELSRLVLVQFAGKWRVARVAQGLLDVLQGDTFLNEDEKKLARGFAPVSRTPPAHIADAPADVPAQERNVFSAAEGTRFARTPGPSLRYQQPQHISQGSGRLRQHEPVSEQVDMADQQSGPLPEFPWYPPIPPNVFGGVADTDSGYLDFFGGYQATDFSSPLYAR